MFDTDDFDIGYAREIGRIGKELSLVMDMDIDMFCVQIRDEGALGDMLPTLSHVSDKLPDYLLGSPTPEIIHRLVASIYLTKAGSNEALSELSITKKTKRRHESYVSTEEFRSAVRDVLENVIIDRINEVHKDDERYWTDSGYMFDKISDGIDEEMLGDPIYGWLDEIIEAIQEIEGFMTYDIDKEGHMYDIVAPVQCGIMNLFEEEE